MENTASDIAQKEFSGVSANAQSIMFNAPN
jgi:hypothetical protein